MTAINELFEKLESHKFDESCCFLCGDDLNDVNRTREHVVPKWIQKKFNLWNQKITLLNGTDFKYSYLTIPCCFNCNNKFLQPIEEILIPAFNMGVEAVRQIDPDILFYWLGKIYFGMMYKELFLSLKQKNPKKGNILTADYLKTFKAHYLFLQGIRGLHKFNGFSPYSLYIVETQCHKQKEEQWDFLDSHNTMFISCRIGSVGLICVLQDGGASKHLEKHLEKYFEIPLHPIQFRELSAKILYKSMLFNRTPKFISFEVNGYIETTMSPLGGLSGLPIYNEWDNDIYGQILSQLTNMPLEFTNPIPGKARTWMVDESGKTLIMDVNKE
jgi:hypothetical protein